MPENETTRPNVYYGGQAVMEGVMIRGPQHMAVAVRHPRGHIVIHSEQLHGIYTGSIRKVPLVRGMVVLYETLALGMRALTFSSRIQLEEEGEPTPSAGADGDEKKSEFPESVFWGTMILAGAFAIGLFFATPIVIAHFLERTEAHRAWIVAAETVIRLGMFVGYIWLIGRLSDIRRVYQYHGAEHMTIHAYENGRPLIPSAIREFPKEHQRCGTSFLLVVIMVALVAFFAFDLLVDRGLLVRIASRIVLVFPIAGVSYEILRFGAKYRSNVLVRGMFIPNIWLQALTTKKPDDDQIEVAVASFEAALKAAGLPVPGRE